MKKFENTRKLMLACCMGAALSLLYLGTPVNAAQENTSAIGAGAQKRTVKNSEKVAEIAFSDQRLVQIYDTGDGGFSYVQSGPYGTTPVSLPDDMAEHGDPIRVFQSLVPGQPIPGSLTRAVGRARALLGGFGLAKNNAREAEESTTALSFQGVSPTLSRRDTNQSGSTGYDGCPEWWFNQASVNGHLFCPNEGDSACYKWVNWAFLAKPKAWQGYGAVCSDSGTAIFQTTSGEAVDTFWVPQGNWQFVQYYPYRACGWFSCSDVRTFQKFELVNGSAVAHFGARVY